MWDSVPSPFAPNYEPSATKHPQPVLTSSEEDKAIAETLDADFPAPRTKEENETIDAIAALLKENRGSHPT